MPPVRHRVSPRVAGLIDRIRGLVAEQRRLERAGAGRSLVQCLELEIERLQDQLANMVRSELSAAR